MFPPLFASRKFLSSRFAACVLLGGVTAFAPHRASAHGALGERIAERLKACQETPADPVAHLNLAEVYLEHEEWENAMVEMDRVEALAPAKFPLDFLRGRALLQSGKPLEALPSLERFLLQFPENASGLLLRARALQDSGEASRALVDFRAALALMPNAEPDVVLEVSNAVAASGDAPGALAVLEQGMSRLGSIPSLSLRALALETQTGRFDAALLRVLALQKTAPRPEPWMAKRAALLATAGRVNESRNAWESLLKHLEALPNLERGSHSMSLLAEKARQALSALPQAPTAASKAANSFPTLAYASRPNCSRP